MTTSVRFCLSYDRFKLDFIVCFFKVDTISVENTTLSWTSLWRYMFAPKCYVTCGHTIFMTWRYPLNNSDVIWTASSEFGTYRICEQRRFRRACASAQVTPEPSLLAHTSSESRGTVRQKARSLAPLNGWACAVEICHDGMLEDTNSLEGAHMIKTNKRRHDNNKKLLRTTW